MTPLFVVEPLPPEPPPVLSLPEPEPEPVFELPLLVKSGGCPVADRCASIPSSVPTEPPIGMAKRPVLTSNRNAMVSLILPSECKESKIKDARYHR